MKTISKNVFIERILKILVWIFGIIIFILAIDNLDSEDSDFLLMSILGLILSSIVRINQTLSISKADTKDKNLFTQCIVFFLIPTVAMLLAKAYFISMFLTILISYPISIFVTYKLSEVLAKIDEIEH